MTKTKKRYLNTFIASLGPDYTINILNWISLWISVLGEYHTLKTSFGKVDTQSSVPCQLILYTLTHIKYGLITLIINKVLDYLHVNENL